MTGTKALVQDYLHINGYFTIADLPALRTRPPGGVRLVTEVDLLAFRLACAGCEPDWTGSRGIAAASTFEPDPALCCPAEQPDMLVVEIGTGRPRRAAVTFDPAVLAATLVRFGCCGLSDAADVVRTLLLHGSARSDGGYLVRLAAFEVSTGTGARGLHLPITHVARFVRQYLDDNWDVLRHAEFPEGALGFQAMLKRAGLAPILPAADAVGSHDAAAVGEVEEPRRRRGDARTHAGSTYT